jgi:hypothetical protein
MKKQGRIRSQALPPRNRQEGRRSSCTMPKPSLVSPRGPLVGVVEPLGPWPHNLIVVLDSPSNPSAPSYMAWSEEKVEIQITGNHGICLASVAHEACHAAEYMTQDYAWSSVDFDMWSPRWSLPTREERVEETKCWIVERVVAAVLRFAQDNDIRLESNDRLDQTGAAL